jgi:nucleoid-associated protein EbfC
MFDKMKQLMEMQKQMQEMKRQLDAATFEMASADNLVKIVMNGSQEIKEVFLQKELSEMNKSGLEKSIRDAYNRAVKKSHQLAAEKMKGMTGLNIPGL